MTAMKVMMKLKMLIIIIMMMMMMIIDDELMTTTTMMMMTTTTTVMVMTLCTTRFKKKKSPHWATDCLHLRSKIKCPDCNRVQITCKRFRCLSRATGRAVGDKTAIQLSDVL